MCTPWTHFRLQVFLHLFLNSELHRGKVSDPQIQISLLHGQIFFYQWSRRWNDSIASLIFWGREESFALIGDRNTVSWVSCPKPSHFNSYCVPAVYFLPCGYNRLWWYYTCEEAYGPPLWSSGQSFWLQLQRSWVRFPALPDFLSGSGSGMGYTQPREPCEVNWGATWIK